MLQYCSLEWEIQKHDFFMNVMWLDINQIHAGKKEI